MCSLEILICSCRREGILRAADVVLPPATGVSYLISWQTSEGADTPDALKGREDVRVVRMEGLGLSRNRNNALDNARGDVLLISDDDVRYTAAGLQQVRKAFADRPAMDYAAFRYEGPDRKRYPDAERDLSSGHNLPRGWYQSSIEIAVRRTAVEKAALRFNEHFGLGCHRYGAGEDELFLLRARRSGLHCRFIPLTVCRHDTLSTGEAIPTPATLRARGVVVALRYPLAWPLRVAAGAAKCKSGRLASLLYQVQGAFYALTSRSLRRYMAAT